MKIHVGAPLLTLAIFFSFIELSSQYNKTLLKADTLTVADDLGLFWTITNKLDILVSDQHNQDIYGLIDNKDNKLVCALEKYEDDYWVRKLIVEGMQVKTTATAPYEWTDEDTDLYQLDFDKVLK
ncbi:uncharacterized protein LOC117172583 [Belonocnema kinseyi]|uniref:uncharacterized protein LOC117172583 n=1 Tax=Belonocnema kinseyi TaxID=2817044 RepID=UPI00143CF531|nr:uncharacterized protein LOC117172583 [Belonocnema kinseyi]XP_033216551.1 uncharacterized protein LOC117172583 [Belonocnema kinseyi]